MILSGATVNTTKRRYCHDTIINVVIVITQTNVLLLRYEPSTLILIRNLKTATQL